MRFKTATKTKIAGFVFSVIDQNWIGLIAIAQVDVRNEKR